MLLTTCYDSLRSPLTVAVDCRIRTLVVYSETWGRLLLFLLLLLLATAFAVAVTAAAAYLAAVAALISLLLLLLLKSLFLRPVF